MINEAYLKSLGFTGFIHVDPSKRDKVKRLVWSHFFEGRAAMTIRLKESDQGWTVELIEVYNTSTRDVIGKDNSYITVEDAIKIVKFYGTNTL